MWWMLACKWNCFFLLFFKQLTVCTLTLWGPYTLWSSSLLQEQGCCTVSKTCSQNVHPPHPLLLHGWLTLVLSLLPDLLSSGPPPALLNRSTSHMTALRLVLTCRAQAPHIANALADSNRKDCIYIFLQSQLDLMFCLVHFCHETT